MRNVVDQEPFVKRNTNLHVLVRNGLLSVGVLRAENFPKIIIILSLPSRRNEISPTIMIPDKDPRIALCSNSTIDEKLCNYALWLENTI